MIKGMPHIILILFSYLIFVSSIKGQTPVDYPGIRHFTPKDGLPSSEVYDIIQDRQGYIWISTDHGVARYNGYEFELFGKEEGLTDPVVFYLFEDHRGWIWMATFQGNIYIYKNGQIEPYQYINAIKEYIANEVLAIIQRIYVDQEGTLFVFYPNRGIISITKNGAIQTLGEEAAHTWLMWIKEEKVFYACPGEEFITVKQQSGTRELFTLANMQAEACIGTIHQNIPFEYPIKAEPIYKINRFEQKLADEVFFQSGNQLLVVDPHTLTINKSTPYPHGIILFYLEAEHSSLVFVGHLSENKGLHIYPSREAFLNFETQENIPYLFAGKTIAHVLEDAQGGIWVATNEDGVYYLSQPEALLATVDDARLYGITDLALEGADSCFVRTKDEKVYAIGAGLKAEEMPMPQPLLKDGRNLFYDIIQNRLYRTGRLKYWENRAWKNVLTKYRESHWTKDSIHNSYNIIPSRKDPNRLFFYGNYSIFDAYRNNGEYEFSKQDIKLIPAQRIFCVFQDVAGTIYVGGAEGLYVYDEISKQFFHQNQHPAFFYRIQEIEQFADSTLVIGTRYEGIILWKDGQTRHISIDEGLSAPYVKTMHVDENQTLWVGTNAGLNRIEVEHMDSIRIQRIDIANGLPSNEIVTVDSREGQIWVATSAGLIKLPKALPNARRAVRPIIEQVYINGKKVSQEEISTLSWRENNLRVEAVSLDYPQQGNIYYRYRFKPNAPWQVALHSDINIAQLTFGRYRFEIQAKGNNGKWSESAKMSFMIKRPIWRNIWFQLITATLLIAFIVWRIWRNQKIKEEKALQIRQLAELEQQLESLRHQAYQAQMNPHFIFNCLTAIQAFMLQDGNDRLIASDYLSKFAKLIRQALNASRSSSISLGEDIDMLRNYIQLEQFRSHFSFDCEIEIAPNVDLYNSQVPPMLIQPYVENAILHGFAGLERRACLSITYKEEEDALTVVVMDNGVGIYQTQQKNKSYISQKAHKYESMGMEISRQRLLMQSTSPNLSVVQVEEIHNQGNIEGTRIIIKIPIH